MGNFASDLQTGRQGEERVCVLLEQAGFVIADKHNKKTAYDIKAINADGNELTIEVKFDVKSKQNSASYKMAN